MVETLFPWEKVPLDVSTNKLVCKNAVTYAYYGSCMGVSRFWLWAPARLCKTGHSRDFYCPAQQQKAW